MDKTSSYESWNSPISAQLVAQNALRLGFIEVEGSTFYYIEGRPAEKGRCVLMQGSSQGEIKEALPKEFSIKSKVHEYGGKCFLSHKNTLYFVNYQDQALYKKAEDGSIHKLFEDSTLRLVDLTFAHQALYAVAERHLEDRIDNMIVRLSLEDGSLEIVASGYDFYAAPRASPDGRFLAWFCWNHPNMPWDASELWLASISSDGSLTNPQCLAGGVEESITSPMWSKNNTLYFLSDKEGFWNFYRYSQGAIEALYPCEIDFGAAHWVFGSERYCFLDESTLAAIGTTKGKDALYLLDLKTSQLKTLKTPFTMISDLYYLGKKTLLFLGTSPKTAPALISFHIETQQYSTLKTSQEVSLGEGFISLPKDISFQTDNQRTSYGFYYPPTHPDDLENPRKCPPLIIRCHSGPTSHNPPKFSLDILYFTSRGFAFFDLNYSGSTGYGRAYRNRLNNQWGEIDVQDCIFAARELCQKGLADPKRLILKGSSAGGYTVLRTFTLPSTSAQPLFQIGACYYGISNLEDLTKNTHKFELHYLSHLIGPYPKEKETYIKRSPIHAVDHLSRPIIFFQGGKDTVVSSSQTKSMYLALCQKKIPTQYFLFEEEGHGFRMSSTLQKCLEEELSFYINAFKTLPK
jgi:dipeptidyl aminopeptidase/acylaminoacyl peptidase